MIRIALLVLASALMTSPALAHTGLGDTAGFSHGFLHPIGGVDHVLTMVAVGLLAAHVGGRALWLVPLTFMTLMAAGGALGMAGVEIPLVEIGIAMSLLVFGLAVAFGVDLPLTGAMALVGVFAIFHGHAHGAEMPETASGLTYGVGFVAATGLLHAVGVALGLGLGKLGGPAAKYIARVGGGAIAVVGLGLLAGVI